MDIETKEILDPIGDSIKCILELDNYIVNNENQTITLIENKNRRDNYYKIRCYLNILRNKDKMDRQNAIVLYNTAKSEIDKYSNLDISIISEFYKGYTIIFSDEWKDIKIDFNCLDIN